MAMWQGVGGLTIIAPGNPVLGIQLSSNRGRGRHGRSTDLSGGAN